MAFFASRTTRAGKELGLKLRTAISSSPTAVTLVTSRGNFDSAATPRDTEELPNVRAKFTFAAVSAVVGATACYSGWNAGLSSSAIHAEAAKGALDPNSFLELKVAKREDINHNTKKFRIALTDPEAVSGLSVASCLLTRAPSGSNDKDGKPSFIIRPYTPVSSPDVKGYFDLVIKIYPGGKMTQHLATLNEGDTLEVKGPIPKIPYVPNMKKHIGMIAGGTGITPMFQVIDAILSNPDDKTKVTLLYANNTPDDILLKKELDDLAEAHPNFKVYYVVSHSEGPWNGGVGYVSLDAVLKGLPSPSDDAMVFVCGPPGMMKAISGDKVSPKDQGELIGVLKEAGYSAKHIFKF